MARIPSPIAPLRDPLFEEKGLEVWIKRDDLIHPYIMGNKWRKLKYNLLFARKNGYEGMLTFGGAYSNHIAATAACCYENGLKSIGIIRGDELNKDSNPTLRYAASQGMQLIFVTRQYYRSIQGESTGLQEKYPGYLCLPEGGTNLLAIQGCSEIVAELDAQFDFVLTPLGTGGTMAGLLQGMNGKGRLIGVSSLKGNFVHHEFSRLLSEANIVHENYEIQDRWHFGGYGRVPDELVDFINQTRQNTGVLFDPIYTGKMYYAMLGLMKEGYFPKGSKILLLHTGGIQGIAGINEKQLKKILL